MGVHRPINTIANVVLDADLQAIRMIVGMIGFVDLTVGRSVDVGVHRREQIKSLVAGQAEGFVEIGILPKALIHNVIVHRPVEMKLISHNQVLS